MTWVKQKFQLQSECPLMMQNVQAVDPTNKFTKEMKKISGKRKKTDADYLRMQEVDFFSGLYLNQNGPCIPASWIEATIIAGAKKEKEGPRAKASIFTEGSFNLEYNGPRTADELWKETEFKDIRPVVVNRSKVMKCRPIFPKWSAEVTVNYDDDISNLDELTRWFSIAGQQCGIGTYRPKHGRFTIKVV